MKRFDGRRIRVAREASTMSRARLADMIKVTARSIWNWEQGRYFPDADELPALAAALQKPVEWFFEELDAES